MKQKDRLVPFFLLTYAITWGLGAFALFLPNAFQALFGKLTDTSPLYYLAVAAPTISATLLTGVQEGRAGLGRLYKRLIHWRFDWRWYALVLVGIPVSGWLVSRLTGTSPLKEFNTTSQLLRLLLYLMITGPLGEELGWRGFALPRLLRHFSPFLASLVLGLLWGVWHLPSFFVAGMVQARLSILLFIFFTPCLTLLVTWIFEHTGGSVLITVLIHYMVNFSASILGVTLPALTVVLLATTVLVLALDRNFGWFKRHS